MNFSIIEKDFEGEKRGQVVASTKIETAQAPLIFFFLEEEIEIWSSEQEKEGGKDEFTAPQNIAAISDVLFFAGREKKRDASSIMEVSDEKEKMQ